MDTWRSSKDPTFPFRRAGNPWPVPQEFQFHNAASVETVASYARATSSPRSSPAGSRRHPQPVSSGVIARQIGDGRTFRLSDCSVQTASRDFRARSVNSRRRYSYPSSTTIDLAGCGKTRRKTIAAKGKHYYDHESGSWINVVRGQKSFFRNLLDSTTRAGFCISPSRCRGVASRRPTAKDSAITRTMQRPWIGHFIHGKNICLDVQMPPARIASIYSLRLLAVAPTAGCLKVYRGISCAERT